MSKFSKAKSAVRKKITFKPNFDLLNKSEQLGRLKVDSDNLENIGEPPYLAVFNKSGKTLVYLAARHRAQETYRKVDLSFDKFRPRIAVVEHERGCRVEIFGLNEGKPFMSEAVYTAAIAVKNNIPVIFADLSNDDMRKVLAEQNPGQSFGEKKLHKILSEGDPTLKKGELNRFSYQLNKYGRDPFMLKNISDALNKHDVVFAVFGEGHYRTHRLVLEDMLGKPEYIFLDKISERNFVIPAKAGIGSKKCER